MGGLLNHARKFFGSKGIPLPGRSQSYSVHCPLGHRVSGMRTEGYQAIRCPSCGEAVFVLPRSPLPEPAVPAARKTEERERKQVAHHPRATVQPDFDDDEPIKLTDPIPATGDRSTRAQEEEPVDGEIEWDDEESEEIPGPPPRPADLPPPKPWVGSPAEYAAEEIQAASAKERPAPSKGKPAAARPKPSPTSKPQPKERAVELPPPIALKERLRRHRNPLIFAGLVVLIVATFAIRSWRARLADMPIVAARGKAEGLPALDAGKFELAHQILSEASRAVEALGDQVDGAEDIKQGAREAAVIMALAPKSLEEMVDEAARAEESEWKKNFRLFYLGRSVIIDANVVNVPNGQGTSQYELDYKVFPEGGDGSAPPKTRGRLETKGLRLFTQSRPNKGDHMIFGAKLASFEYDREREEWSIGFEPESGVHMTHAKAREALGWPSADNESEEARP